MKKIISTVAAVAVMGIVANAMATSTTPATTATKPAAATTTTGATTTAPAAAKATTPATTAAAPAAKPATPATTTTAVAPAAKPATTTTAANATSVTGQVVAMDPATIKVKDLKSNQEWALNVGTANVKTYKVGDKVMCTYDGATKTLKTIEMAK